MTAVPTKRGGPVFCDEYAEKSEYVRARSSDREMVSLVIPGRDCNLLQPGPVIG